MPSTRRPYPGLYLAMQRYELNIRCRFRAETWRSRRSRSKVKVSSVWPPKTHWVRIGQNRASIERCKVIKSGHEKEHSASCRLRFRSPSSRTIASMTIWSYERNTCEQNCKWIIVKLTNFFLLFSMSQSVDLPLGMYITPMMRSDLMNTGGDL